MNSSSSAPNAWTAWPRFGSTNSSRGGPVLDRLVEQHQLVLAEHALGQVAEHDPDLGGHHKPIPISHRRPQRAQVVARALEHRVEQRPHRVDVAGHPLAAADPLGRRQRPRGLQPGVGDDALLGLGGERGQVGSRAAARRRCRRRRRRSARRGSSRSRRDPLELAERLGRPRGDHRRGRRRRPAAPERVIAPGEADQAARLAHDQLAGGGIDAARARAATPSRRTARRATWHSDAAIVPSARRR